MQSIEIGATPCNEPCAQVGEPDYANTAKIECHRFLRQMQRQFPIPKSLSEEISYVVKRQPYEDGFYFEVAIKFNRDSPKAQAFALAVERESPAHWDAIAQTEIAIEKGWSVRITNAPPNYDGFGTVCAQTLNVIERRLPYRRVMIDPCHLEWQIQRYQSGMYPAFDEQEWQDVEPLIRQRTNVEEQQ